MSTIKSSNEHLTLNADGSGKDIKFQSNGSEVASISDGGVVTATSYAGSGANLTGISSVGGATGVDFNDNVKARFGTSNDLEIYHDATNSLLVNNTGGLRLCSDTVYFRNAANNENGLVFTADGSVDLYHNNSIRLQTNATGIQLGMDGSLDGGIVSAIHSLFFNIDSDNNSSGQQIRFATNHNSGASGGNTLLSIKEDGRGLSQFTAKAWADFDQSTVHASHNVSSITDNGTGDYTLNWTNNMASVNYATSGLAETAGYVSVWIQAAGSLRIKTANGASGSYTDYPAAVIAFGA